ncbi:MAG TPA: efflux RND transporter periplasmic adaptor subunit [Gemmatimonadales bacterium]
MRRLCILAALFAMAGCKKQEAQVVYQAVPVERRDIAVSALASGTLQPDTTVEVKSKASGEILQLLAETGQLVKRGAPLVRVDPRNARNLLAQAQANLDVAKAQLANATSQKNRSDELYKSQSITEQEHEQSVLDFADAKSAVVNAQVSVDNAKIQLEDTDVRAPITGTVIEKDVERGAVIASATNNVSGGTTLLKMADLNLVQVRTLVDETDIGKIRVDLPATITVDAYPNRPFDGVVLKIEPQAVTEQNVTMFPVLVRIDNRAGLLRPGMNADVEIHVGRRDSVLAVPNAALRTQRDVGSAASVLGLAPDEVTRQLAAQQTAARPADSAGTDSTRVASAGAGRGASGDSTGSLQRGGAVRGDSMRARTRIAGGNARRGQGMSNRYIVFVKRGGRVEPVWIRTGLTDMDYSEVQSGLEPGDSVLLLPSASLVQSQTDMKERMNRMTGGGGAVPGMRTQTTTAPQGTGSR